MFSIMPFICQYCHEPYSWVDGRRNPTASERLNTSLFRLWSTRCNSSPICATCFQQTNWYHCKNANHDCNLIWTPTEENYDKFQCLKDPHMEIPSEPKPIDIKKILESMPRNESLYKDTTIVNIAGPEKSSWWSYFGWK